MVSIESTTKLAILKNQWKIVIFISIQGNSVIMASEKIPLMTLGPSQPSQLEQGQAVDPLLISSDLKKRSSLLRKRWLGLLALSTVFIVSLIVGVSLSDTAQAGHLNYSKVNGTCPSTPEAPRRPSARTMHGETVTDEFAWMNETKRYHDDLMEYIKTENEYTRSYLQSTAVLQSDLVREMKQMDGDGGDTGKNNDFPHTDFWLMDRYFYFIDSSSKDYAMYYRFIRQADNTGGSIVVELDAYHKSGGNVPGLEKILDLNEIYEQAQNASYLTIGTFVVSYSEEYAAYNLDWNGNERFTLYVRNLTAGTNVAGIEIPSTYYGLAWLKDNWIFYNTLNDMEMPMSVYRTCIQQCGGIGKPELVYAETEPSLTVEVSSSVDGQMVFIRSEGQVTTHVRYVRSDDLQLRLLIRNPTTGAKHFVMHAGGHFYIMTNAGAPYRQIMRINSSLTETELDLKAGSLVLPEQKGRFLRDFQVFDSFLVVYVWQNARHSIIIVNLSESFPFVAESIQFTEYDVYSLNPWTYPYSSRSTSFVYSNNTYLLSKGVYEHHVATGKTYSLKAPSKRYSRSEYTESLVQYPSYDNVTLIAHVLAKQQPSTGPRKALVSAYGGYGDFSPPEFASHLPVLLNRGFIYVYVYVRGDGELGPEAYVQGKLTYKMNSFLDFRRSMLHLVSLGLTKPGWIGVYSRSAGGLIAGTTINWFGDVPNKGSRPSIKGIYPVQMRAEIERALDPMNSENKLVKATIAHVPYIDAINDMLDPMMPWTVYEWAEWGNPWTKDVYQAMRDYSPYENVVPRDYPATLVWGGLKDSRVKFYEPTRFAAQLRRMKLNNDCVRDVPIVPLLLRIDEFGHFGGTGDDFYKDKALQYAFFIHELQ